MTDRAPNMPPFPELAKEDTVALWHAVEAYKAAVRTMRSMPEFSAALVEAESGRLVAATRALRKVNAIRKVQAAISPTSDDA